MGSSVSRCIRRKKSCKCLKHRWSVWTCADAALGGHLECLTYAHEEGCPWHDATCSFAALGGHLECLTYAHENGCPWTSNTCLSAASGGHLDCLIYAHENGCPWHAETCAAAADKGHLACLKFAHENGCPWSDSTCARAACGGSLECLTYAHENGCHWSSWTCSNAAVKGQLECLAYALGNGCPWNTSEIMDAIRHRAYDDPSSAWRCAVYVCGRHGLPIWRLDVRHRARLIVLGRALQTAVRGFLLRRRLRRLRERMAARTIVRAARCYLYAPGGPGFRRAREGFSRSLFLC